MKIIKLRIIDIKFTTDKLYFYEWVRIRLKIEGLILRRISDVKEHLRDEIKLLSIKKFRFILIDDDINFLVFRRIYKLNFKY